MKSFLKPEEIKAHYEEPNHEWDLRNDYKAEVTIAREIIDHLLAKGISIERMEWILERSKEELSRITRNIVIEKALKTADRQNPEEMDRAR
ncbi:MAG: hypothetical protein VB118_04660 [Oscillospiraceae bacterium]|nr:hypothetical protein [Oscillospiraceae bacterium]